MRGTDARTVELFSYVDLEKRVPAKHPLRLVRGVVNDVLAALDSDFAKAYDGPPTDPKVFEEQQKKLQEELQHRADEARKKLESQQGTPTSSAAPPPGGK